MISHIKWINFVKMYQKKHELSYKDALIRASSPYQEIKSIERSFAKGNKPLVKCQGGVCEVVKAKQTLDPIQDTKEYLMVDEISCQKRYTKKYRNRKSPPFPGNDMFCRGMTARGNDGKLYLSKPNKNGVYSWRILK